MFALPPNPISDAIGSDGEIDVIKTITVCSPCVDANAITLRIAWDNWGPQVPREDREKIAANLSMTSVEVTGRRPDSFRLLHVSASPAAIEAWMEELGWALGAGYLMRWTKPPLPRDANPLDMMWGAAHAFGGATWSMMGQPDTYGDGDADLLALAARHGWREWECNCAYRKADGATGHMFASWRKHDQGLEDDGARRTIFPGWSPSKLLTIAKTFEEPQSDGDERLVLCIPYNMVTRRIDPRLL